MVAPPRETLVGHDAGPGSVNAFEGDDLGPVPVRVWWGEWETSGR